MMEISLDGIMLQNDRIPLVADGKLHKVEIVLFTTMDESNADASTAVVEKLWNML